MKLPEWVRHLPHPGYGNYGGRTRRCVALKAKVCPLPIDGMDSLFQEHDGALRIAKMIIEAGGTSKGEAMREVADEKLAKGLASYKGSYKRKIYGPIYRWLSRIAFR